MNPAGGAAPAGLGQTVERLARAIDERPDLAQVAPEEFSQALNRAMNYVVDYKDVRTLVTAEQEKKERIGVYGTLTIGFLALGLNYAFLLGFVAGLLSIVPYLGIMISLVPALILAAVQFGDWWHPALVLAVFGIVQLLEGFVISPKIIGDRVGLHPLTIIIAVMVGTTLMGGVLGGVLAIPLTAALRTLMFRYVWRQRAANG